MPLHPLTNLQPSAVTSLAEIEAGLRAPVKTLPSKLFYDERGSELFDRICRLPEYYLTRTEQAIMDVWAGEMCAEIGAGALLVEFGSGSSLKTRALLDRLADPAGYVPVDISAEHLAGSAREIAGRYPSLDVLPVCADYEQPLDLPAPPSASGQTVVYFPGSTIGNFHPDDAVAFLGRIRTISHSLLIGVDLKKDPGLLHRAYNDCDGITAAFNLNLLAHINRVYGLAFDLEAFDHKAAYNQAAGRIEMYLRSRTAQAIQVNGSEVRFDAGECIWTESSYKYTLDEFAALAGSAGLQPRRVWTDANRLFAVQYLEPFDSK